MKASLIATFLAFMLLPILAVAAESYTAKTILIVNETDQQIKIKSSVGKHVHTIPSKPKYPNNAANVSKKNFKSFTAYWSRKGHNRGGHVICYLGDNTRFIELHGKCLYKNYRCTPGQQIKCILQLTKPTNY